MRFLIIILIFVLNSCAFINFPTDIRGRVFIKPKPAFKSLKIVYDFSNLYDNDFKNFNSKIIRTENDTLSFHDFLIKSFKNIKVDISDTCQTELKIIPEAFSFILEPDGIIEKKHVKVRIIFELKSSDKLYWNTLAEKGRVNSDYLIISPEPVTMLGDCLEFICNDIPKYMCSKELIECSE